MLHMRCIGPRYRFTFNYGTASRVKAELKDKAQEAVKQEPVDPPRVARQQPLMRATSTNEEDDIMFLFEHRLAKRKRAVVKREDGSSSWRRAEVIALD